MLSTNNNLLVSWTGAANDIAYLIYSCRGAWRARPTMHAVVPSRGRAGRHRANPIATSDIRLARTKISAPTLPSGRAGAGPVRANNRHQREQRHALDRAWRKRDRSRCATTTACRSTRPSARFVRTRLKGGTVGGIVEFPATSAYPLGQSINLYGCWGVTLVAGRRAKRRRRASGRTRMARRDRRHRHQYEQGGRLASHGAVGLGDQRQHARGDYRR